MPSSPITAAITAWMPIGHGLDDSVARRLAADARRVVARAEWNSVTAAKLACGHVFRFLAWAEEQGSDACTSDSVNRYLDHLRANGAPNGTIKPARAALRRCIPESVPATPSRSSTDPGAAIAAYTPDPERIAPELWERIADEARASVAATAPGSADQAVTRLAPTSLYLAWAEASCDPGHLFAPDSVERFLAIGRTAWPTSTYRTYASLVRHVARSARPDLWPAPAEKTRAAAAPIYDLSELEAIARSVSGRTPTPRRHVGALLVLGRGAGVIGAAAAAVRPRDVRRQDGQLVVDVTHGPAPRLVPVLEPLAEPLEQLARRSVAAGDDYLLGGRSEQRFSDRSSELLRTHAELTAVRIEPAKLRNGWLAELITQPLGLRKMLELAGLRSTTQLDAVLRAGTVEADPERLSRIARLL